MTIDTIKKIGLWAAGDDTGNSSKFLCNLALGNLDPDIHYPYDPSDFGRCYRFLELLSVEEAAAVMKLAFHRSEKWQAIVENWVPLTALYLEECVGPNWRAPKLYQLMRDIGL